MIVKNDGRSCPYRRTMIKQLLIIVVCLSVDEGQSTYQNGHKERIVICLSVDEGQSVRTKMVIRKDPPARGS